jgi:hypothetical protein
MKQYTNNLHVVQAMQFEYSDTGIEQLKGFLGEELIQYGKDRQPYAMGWAEIGVVEHNHNLAPPAKYIATEGDYVVKDINGEFFTCKLDFFNEYYSEIIQKDK